MESIAHEIYEHALEQHPFGIVIFDRCGKPIYHNSKAKLILDDAIDKPITSLFPNNNKLDAFLTNQVNTDTQLDITKTIDNWSFTLSSDNNRNIYLSIKKENDNLLHALQEAQENIKQLDNVISDANIGCWNFFPQEKKIIANKTWVTQKKYLDQEIRKDDALFSEVINGFEKWSEIIHPDDLQFTLDIIKAHLDGKTQTYDATFRMMCGDGKWRWFHARGKVSQRDSSGNAIRMSGVHIDVTEAKDLEHRIENLLRVDSLTNVMSRRFFESHTQNTIYNCRRTNSYLAFLLLDIDFFKQFNDCYGHLAGDKCLQSVGKVINGALQREGDACFRLGGEEFAIIFQVDEQKTAEKFAHHIKNTIESLKIPHKKNTASQYITVSIGLWCGKAENTNNVSDIYKQADSLLYQAKSTGRNKIKAI